MRYKLRVIVVALALIVGLAVYSISKPSACYEPYKNDRRTNINGKSINLEVISSQTDLEKGLSGRECIGNNQGMLFVFDESSYHPFWMKDMRFSIDMIWIDEDRKVVTIKQNVSPLTYPKTFSSSKPAKYVMELKAGRAKELNLREGTAVNL